MKLKMNFIISMICSILLGYLCATVLFESEASTKSVYNEKEEIYFLRYNKENKEEKINYIKVKEDNEEKLYAGISTSLENIKKIKEMYENEGIELIVEEKKVDSKEFISELSQYDILLKSSKTIDEISSVLSTILATYEESVLER